MVRLKFQYVILMLRKMLFLTVVILLIIVYKERRSHRMQVAARIPRNALKYIFFDRVLYNKPKYITQLRSIIVEHNLNVTNTDIIGPIQKDAVVLVVNVNKLSIYLEFLLVSLSQVRGIEKAIIIFSHSHFDANINNLIRSIDFCRIIQIFYPYSTQLYPDEFPGFSPDDCPHYMNSKDAEAKKCTGWNRPDMHGHYRNPKFVQSKHHWWWTANTVFESLLSTVGHKGIVIFLQDDIYVLQDFLHMILYMKRTADLLPNCEFITLESLSPKTCFECSQGLNVNTYNPIHESSVIGFDINIWNSIGSHYDLFCTVDEFSWARSLFYMSMNRKDGLKYRIMSSVLPRAFKTSACGLDGTLVNCDAIESLYQILNLQNENVNSLFPKHLEIHVNMEAGDEFYTFEYADTNGGWSDSRDIELCYNFTASKIRKVVMEMQNELSGFNLYPS